MEKLVTLIQENLLSSDAVVSLYQYRGFLLFLYLCPIFFLSFPWLSQSRVRRHNKGERALPLPPPTAKTRREGKFLLLWYSIRA